MSRRLAFALLTLLLAVPAHAGFDDIVYALESRLGHSTWIPFFGLARSVVRIAHPEGVHDVQLAVFDGKGALDPLELERLMNTRVGRDFTPLVRVRSRHQHEATLIYARPLRGYLELMVLSSDGDDTVLVRVVVDPDVVTRYLDDDPRSVALVARR
ncbi:MAG TPA: hypothetical protein VGK31_01600 [Thermoanaerobaculia bacterium]